MAAREDYITATTQAGDAYASAAANLQKDADQTRIDALTAQVQDLQQQLADCQAGNVVQQTTLMGSACAGWWSGKAGTAKETRQQGTARIQQAFPGIGVWRTWETNPSYLDKSIQVFLDTGSVSNVQSCVNALLAYNTKTNWLSCWHEPENDNVAIADWQKIQMQAGAVVAQNGKGKVRYVSLLMGETGIPSRNPPTSADQWFNFDLGNIYCIGCDLYQNAKDDASADRAQDTLGPWIALARKLNKPLVIGEFGVRRVNPPWSPGISDSARATYAQACITMMDTEKFANGKPVVEACMIYESDSGTSGRLPWNILGPPGQTAPYSPKVQQVWAARFAKQK